MITLKKTESTGRITYCEAVRSHMICQLVDTFVYRGGCSINLWILLNKSSSMKQKVFFSCFWHWRISSKISSPIRTKKTDLFHAVPNFRCCPKIISLTQLQLSLHQPLRQPDLGLPQHVATEKRDTQVAIVTTAAWRSWKTAGDTISIIPYHPHVPREWCRKNTSLAWSLLHERTEMMVEYMSLCKDVGSQLVGQAYACTKEVSQRIWNTSPRLLHVCTLLGTNISHLGFWKILFFFGSQGDYNSLQHICIIFPTKMQKDMELIVGLFWEDSRFSRIYFPSLENPEPAWQYVIPNHTIHHRQQQQQQQQ